MTRRQKKKIKKLGILILFLIVVGVIIFFLIKLLFGGSNSSKDYSDEANAVISEENLEKIYKFDYSKTLENILESKEYNDNYLEDYLKIDFVETDDFADKVNKYLNIGYKASEVNNIFKLSSKNQEKILNLSKQKDFSDYLSFRNFDINNLERYEEYKKENKDEDLQTVVTHVNLNLDKEFYTDTERIENPDEITTLINKFHYVDKDFVPKDLVTLFDSKIGAKLVRVAAEAYEKFIETAKNDGITLESTTAYRSYSFQNTLYTNYVAEDGQEKADTYSARPGTSEHQLGLAVDLNDPNVSGARLDDKDFKWVKENSYKYGFILRYLEEFVPVTGYMEEPWHIRYLGVDLATKVYKSGLTYDEYYDMYLKEY